MSTQDVIDRLSKAKGGDREIDQMIAKIMGASDKAIPAYTSNLQEALNLAQNLSPNHAGGCSWDDELCHARINDGPTCAAATPALALCMAAMHLKLSFVTD